jgi:hypothetical protein
MTRTTTLPQIRPLRSDIEITSWLDYWKLINWSWLLQRIPMLLFAVVSSYGVGHYLSLSGVPSPFYQLGSISFDIGFLGVIAIADQQLKKTWWSNIAFYILNGTLAALAALFNVLAHSNGRYADISPEAITAGAPFAFVGLAFSMFYNMVMQQKIDEEIDAIKKNDEEEKEQAQYEKDNPYLCACGQRFQTAQKRVSHRRSCEVYKANT